MKRRVLRKPIRWVIIIGMAFGIYLIAETLMNPIVIKKTIQWELGEQLTLQPFDFFTRLPSDQTPLILTDLDVIDVQVEDTYPVEIQLKDRVYVVQLIIKDTTPPLVIAQDKTVALNQSLVPMDFIVSVEDSQSTTVVFEKTPSVSSEHQETVSLKVTDQSGNSVTVKATLTVVLDNQEPVLVEQHPLYVAVNALNPDYWTDTEITDESGIGTTTVDVTQTDLTKVGITKVTLNVTDTYGNTLNYVRDVHVVFETTALTMNGLFNEQNSTAEPYAQTVYDQLIKPSMTGQQKMRAIYDYLLGVRYRNEASIDYSVDTYNKMDEYAKIGLTKKQGHCFHYASIAAILLQKAGFEVTLIKGEGYSATEPDHFLLHYWVLVNVDGKVYHFDPLYELLYDNPSKYSFFLVEDDYTYKRTHLWDRSLYPVSP